MLRGEVSYWLAVLKKTVVRCALGSENVCCSSDVNHTTSQGALEVNQPIQLLTSIKLCPSQAPLSLQVTQLCSLWRLLRLQFQHLWLVLQHHRHHQARHPRWQCLHPCPLHCPGCSINPQDWLQLWPEPNYVKYIG